MLRIPTLPLSVATAETLAEWQTEVDAFADHARRIEAGKALWKSHQSETGSVTGPDGEVRLTLRAMCYGIERCMYCEDSIAHQIEHIWPKHHYPDRVFSWPNMLYACHPCNGPKTSKFALRLADGRELELGSIRDAPPPAGRALLIDPRTEDPCAFFELDLIDTFWFTIPDTVTGDDRRRAEYTLEVLRLNTRAALARARRQAYGNYRSRLREYIEVKRELEATAPHALPARPPHPLAWSGSCAVVRSTRMRSSSVGHTGQKKWPRHRGITGPRQARRRLGTCTDTRYTRRPQNRASTTSPPGLTPITTRASPGASFTQA